MTKNFAVGENFRIYNTVLTGKFRKFSPIAKIFRQIDLQYNSLVKKLIWRNFCKISLGNHLQISTMLLRSTLLGALNKNFQKIRILKCMIFGPKIGSSFYFVVGYLKCWNYRFIESIWVCLWMMFFLPFLIGGERQNFSSTKIWKSSLYEVDVSNL